jgi:tetratricopeptide (TPR) repeat protein
MNELQRAIDLDPRFAEAQAEWAIARLVGSPSNQELDSAAAAINRALELKPQLLRAQAARGLWLLQSTPPDAAAAESVLRGVLEQDPNMSDALLWLSNALSLQDRGDEGLEILQRASRIDPLHPSIAGNLFTQLSERGNDESARRLLERQLQQPNPSLAIYAILRDFYRLRGRLVEFNAMAKDAALHSADAHFLLAESHALLGDYSAAEKWFERSMKDYPDWPFEPYQGAIVPNWRGDVDEARQRFEQGMKTAGIRIEDQGSIARIWYGSLLARSGHHAAAIRLLEPLAVADPRLQPLETDIGPQHDGWHALAWSYQHTGNESKAARILSELLDQCRSEVDDRQHPADSGLLHYCAETALMAGDSERALALLKRAVQAGWRDCYLRRNDTYWAALATDPRYRALMSTVQADVDRQRAEVQRIDATDGFVARLDAAMAARLHSEN